jgi:hypothetical protein
MFKIVYILTIIIIKNVCSEQILDDGIVMTSNLDLLGDNFQFGAYDNEFDVLKFVILDFFKSFNNNH